MQAILHEHIATEMSSCETSRMKRDSHSNGHLHSAANAKDEGNSSKEDTSRQGKEDREGYELGQYGYGKNYVKLLHVYREGSFHTIREYEVDTRLKLQSKKDFIAGDNKDIIATDTQKNIVYVLAKKYGVSPSRRFTLHHVHYVIYEINICEQQQQNENPIHEEI
jgi:urate oxidase